MIFVSVGGQKPFPRLCEAVSRLAKAASIECFMQTCDPDARYANIETIDFVDSAQFTKRLNECELFISHAGMGNVLAAREREKTIMIMPRLSSLNEHRNDHQVATARALDGRSGIIVTPDGDSLLESAMAFLSGMGVKDTEDPRFRNNIVDLRLGLSKTVRELLLKKAR